MEQLIQDLKYALRMLRRSPGFTAVAVASLALGIGANTAIFSLLNSVLLQYLPVREPQQLVMLSDPSNSGVSMGMSQGERGLFTYQEFLQLRDRTRVFAGMFASESDLSRISVGVEGGPPEEVQTRLVSGEYFPVLGVTPILGRAFAASDEKSLGSAPYAVISHEWWQRRFGGKRDVLGKTLRIQKTTFTIIGVTAPGFSGETVGQRCQMWLPLSMETQTKPGRDWLHDAPGKLEKIMWLHVFARLKPGVSIAQAQSNSDLIFRQTLTESYGSMLTPETRREFLDQRLRVREAGRGASTLRDQFSEPLFVLLAVVALVLLIACANLANLLLARATARQKEIAVRLAIGAGRWRLIRQLLTESLCLSLLGGLAGLLLAQLANKALLQLVSNPRDPVQLNVSPDARVLLFTAGLTVLTGVLFGLAPALRATRVDLGTRLKDTARGIAGSTSKLHMGKMLVIGQIGLSLLLLVGAGLFLKTLYNLRNVDLGYSRDNLLLVRVDGLGSGYAPNQLGALYKSLLERLRATAGVKGATYSENGLFSGSESGDKITVEGYTPKGKKDNGSRFDVVGPRYFSTVGIPVLLGRELEERDQSASTRVSVVNEAFAKLFFAGRNPLGRHLTTEFGDAKTTFEIIGVARDSRDHQLREAVLPRFFVPSTAPSGEYPAAVNFEIRTAGEPNAMIATLRRAIQDVDRNVSIIGIRPITELLESRMVRDRIMAELSAVFGGIALLLAAIGLYGVLSYGIAQRTNEIGIRMALGARRASVITMILRETSIVLGIGLAVGIAAALGLTRLIASRLFGLQPSDPLTYLYALLVMSCIALVAGFVPAYRASRVDPLVALRYE